MPLHLSFIPKLQPDSAGNLHTAGDTAVSLGPVKRHAALCRALLFSKDFRQHVEAADMLLGQLSDIPDAALSNLDLLLRWAVLRMCDGNTQCLLKVLEMCKALLELCQQMVGDGVLQARLLSDMSRLLQLCQLMVGSSVGLCWQAYRVCLAATNALPVCLGPWQAWQVCLHVHR